jgi:hypothetical protein
MRTLEESAGETARLGRIVRIIGWAVAVGAIPSVAHNALAARSTSALVLLVAQGGALRPSRASAEDTSTRESPCW